MNKGKNVIPIFFAIDDGYIPFLAVAIKSLIENASKEYEYIIKVLHTNVKEKNVRKIKKFETENSHKENYNGDSCNCHSFFVCVYKYLAKK